MEEESWDMEGFPADPYLWSQRGSLPPQERLSLPGGHPAAGLGELDGQERSRGHRWQEAGEDTRGWRDSHTPKEDRAQRLVYSRMDVERKWSSFRR